MVLILNLVFKLFSIGFVFGLWASTHLDRLWTLWTLFLLDRLNMNQGSPAAIHSAPTDTHGSGLEPFAASEPSSSSSTGRSGTARTNGPLRQEKHGWQTVFLVSGGDLMGTSVRR